MWNSKDGYNPFNGECKTGIDFTLKKQINIILHSGTETCIEEIISETDFWNQVCGKHVHRFSSAAQRPMLGLPLAKTIYLPIEDNRMWHSKNRESAGTDVMQLLAEWSLNPKP